MLFKRLWSRERTRNSKWTSRKHEEDKRSLLSRGYVEIWHVWVHACKTCSRPSNDDLLTLLGKTTGKIIGVALVVSA